MRLTKFGHSCVRLDTGEGTIVIDPGVFSDPAALDGADAVFITHQHTDHCNDPALRLLAEDRPDARIYGPDAVSKTLADVPFTAVSAGDAIPVAGTEVRVFGEHHARVHDDVPVVQNVGYLMDGIYHPGDSFTVPDEPVRALLVPVAAPWLKLAEAIEFIRAVDAPAVYPIHDAILSDEGLAIVDRILSNLIGQPFQRIPNGVEKTV